MSEGKHRATDGGLDAKLDRIEQWLADMGGITSDAFARTISEARLALATSHSAANEMLAALKAVLERAEREYQELTDGEHGSFEDYPEAKQARAVIARAESSNA